MVADTGVFSRTAIVAGVVGTMKPLHTSSATAICILRRHNAVLDLLAESITPNPAVMVRVNRQVPLYDLLPGQDIPEAVARCCPELVAINRELRLVTVTDVTIPYEDRWRSIAEPHERKYATYAPLAQN